MTTKTKKTPAKKKPAKSFQQAVTVDPATLPTPVTFGEIPVGARFKFWEAMYVGLDEPRIKVSDTHYGIEGNPHQFPAEARYLAVPL